jgi:hypothetical protein
MTAADIPVIDEAKLEAFVGQACSTWVQRLFAAGLTVQSVATGMREDAPAERLERVVSGIDDTIGQIRTSIFQSRAHLGPQPGRYAPGCSTWSPRRPRCSAWSQCCVSAARSTRSFLDRSAAWLATPCGRNPQPWTLLRS